MEPSFAIFAVIIGVAALVQGTVGFAFGLVSMSLLPLFMEVKTAVPLVALLVLLVNASILVRLWKHVDRRRYLGLLAGALFGTPVGFHFLRTMDPTVIKISLGVLLVLYSVWALRGAAVAFGRLHARWGYVFGLFSGVLGGAFATSGPPALVFVTAQGWSRDESRANLQLLFAFDSLVVVALALYSGMLTLDRIVEVSPMFVLVPTLTWIGSRVGDYVRPDVFRRVILVFLLGMGLVFVSRGLL